MEAFGLKVDNKSHLLPGLNSKQTIITPKRYINYLPLLDVILPRQSYIHPPFDKSIVLPRCTTFSILTSMHSFFLASQWLCFQIWCHSSLALLVSTSYIERALFTKDRGQRTKATSYYSFFYHHVFLPQRRQARFRVPIINPLLNNSF